MSTARRVGASSSWVALPGSLRSLTSEGYRLEQVLRRFSTSYPLVDRGCALARFDPAQTAPEGNGRQRSDYVQHLQPLTFRERIGSETSPAPGEGRAPGPP